MWITLDKLRIRWYKGGMNDSFTKEEVKQHEKQAFVLGLAVGAVIVGILIGWLK